MARLFPPQVWRMHNKILLRGSGKEREGCGFLRNFPPRKTTGFKEQLREDDAAPQQIEGGHQEEAAKEKPAEVIYSSTEVEEFEEGLGST